MVIGDPTRSDNRRVPPRAVPILTRVVSRADVFSWTRDTPDRGGRRVEERQAALAHRGLRAETRPGVRDRRGQGPMAGQKIRIRLKAYDHEVIDTSARKIVDTVTRTGAKVAGPVPLPTEKNVYCVIRSPHKYKDSRE